MTSERLALFHPSGITFGLADGSVRFINKGISAASWAAPITPSGGEVPGSDYQTGWASGSRHGRRLPAKTYTSSPPGACDCATPSTPPLGLPP